MRLLVVDDEPPIRKLLAQFLSTKGFSVEAARDASEALQTLEKEPCDLVLSDVNMPGMNGLALLGEVRRLYPRVPVLMLTGCEDVGMAVEAMKAGALDYVLKPFQLARVEGAVRSALHRSRTALEESDRVRRLEQTVENQTVELRGVLSRLEEDSIETLDALVAALDAREHETQAHSHRVAAYAVALGRARGMNPAELETLRKAAMLHDIGKIGVPDSVLMKAGMLTDEEWLHMRRHPQIGYWILRGIAKLRDTAEIVLSHHERFDGRGYPRGLSGREIVVGARIFSVTDTLDAITSNRPYRTGKSFVAAREEIAAHSGGQFDPDVVATFLDIDPEIWADIRSETLTELHAPVSHLTLRVLEECRLEEA